MLTKFIKKLREIRKDKIKRKNLMVESGDLQLNDFYKGQYELNVKLYCAVKNIYEGACPIRQRE